MSASSARTSLLYFIPSSDLCFIWIIAILFFAVGEWKLRLHFSRFSWFWLVFLFLFLLKISAGRCECKFSLHFVIFQMILTCVSCLLISKSLQLGVSASSVSLHFPIFGFHWLEFFSNSAAEILTGICKYKFSLHFLVFHMILTCASCFSISC